MTPDEFAKNKAVERSGKSRTKARGEAAGRQRRESIPGHARAGQPLCRPHAGGGRFVRLAAPTGRGQPAPPCRTRGAACTATIAAFVVLAASASAEVRITRDTGGNTDDYKRRVDALRRSGERVVIDGRCDSACTLHLTLPRQQFCVTGRAAFTFHALADTQTGLPRLR